ncbi:hypothetical protein [Salmon gill poxvirus]|nr:hypothetical protein [Salmon gill poxvirus]
MVHDRICCCVDQDISLVRPFVIVLEFSLGLVISDLGLLTRVCSCEQDHCGVCTFPILNTKSVHLHGDLDHDSCRNSQEVFVALVSRNGITCFRDLCQCHMVDWCNVQDVVIAICVFKMLPFRTGSQKNLTRHRSDKSIHLTTFLDHQRIPRIFCTECFHVCPFSTVLFHYYFPVFCPLIHDQGHVCLVCATECQITVPIFQIDSES